MTNQPSDNKKPPRVPKPPKMLPKNNKAMFGWVMIIGLGIMLAIMFGGKMGGGKKITLNTFWQYVDNDQIAGTIRIESTKVEGQLKSDVPLAKGQSRKFYANRDPKNESFENELARRLKAAGSTAGYEVVLDSWWSGILPSLLMMLVVFGLLWFFLFRRMGAAGGGAGFLGSFGRSRHRLTTKEQSKITFADVAGIDDAKEEVQEIIEFLKNPKKFSCLGGRVPRGVLLVGEPGCGKTLLAKAIAGEADVPFFSISGSDFVEMFVGVGASRVRDLFKQAKDSSPCIIFLDEIDAVGRRRGAGFNGGGHDEREQTLNAILVEMDGFDSSDQVIVCAATNRSDVLDPALTRPGRFDRQISVSLPDLKGRYQILKIYADKVKCSDDVDLQRMARGTPMFSGADLAALVNEAAIAAAMQNQETITHSDFEEARDRVRWGRSRKNRAIDEKERQLTAYHEAGHALVQAVLPDTDPLHKVSIIPRGPMGGATMSLPEKDRYYYSQNFCRAQIAVAMGGQLAEKIFCGDISSGAQSDIAMATELAKKMVLDWGMSEKLGPVNYANDDKHILPMEVSGKNYSEQTAELVDSEIKSIIETAQARARNVIEEKRDKLEDIAQALLKYETISAGDVEQILDGKKLDKPTVAELLEAERKKIPNGEVQADSAKSSVANLQNNQPQSQKPPLPEMG